MRPPNFPVHPVTLCLGGQQTWWADHFTVLGLCNGSAGHFLIWTGDSWPHFEEESQYNLQAKGKQMCLFTKFTRQAQMCSVRCWVFYSEKNHKMCKFNVACFASWNIQSRIFFFKIWVPLMFACSLFLLKYRTCRRGSCYSIFILLV